MSITSSAALRAQITTLYSKYEDTTFEHANKLIGEIEGLNSQISAASQAPADSALAKTLPDLRSQLEQKMRLLQQLDSVARKAEEGKEQTHIADKSTRDAFAQVTSQLLR